MAKRRCDAFESSDIFESEHDESGRILLPFRTKDSVGSQAAAVRKTEQRRDPPERTRKESCA